MDICLKNLSAAETTLRGAQEGVWRAKLALEAAVRKEYPQVYVVRAQDEHGAYIYGKNHRGIATFATREGAEESILPRDMEDFRKFYEICLVDSNRMPLVHFNVQLPIERLENPITRK